MYLIEPEWCDAVDCGRQQAIENCPVVCSSEPHWCAFADCTAVRAMKDCKKTCSKKPETTEKATTTTEGKNCQKYNFITFKCRFYND